MHSKIRQLVVTAAGTLIGIGEDGNLYLAKFTLVDYNITEVKWNLIIDKSE